MTSPRILSLLCVLFPTLTGCTQALALALSEGELAVPENASPEELERLQPTGPYAGERLFVEADGNARDQADEWRITDPTAAEVMEEVADTPISLWIGDWMGDVQAEVDDAVTRAGDALQVLTVYNIPNRDCGAWSAGGVSDAAEYADFIDEVAAGLDGRLAIVVLEPDALGVVDCLDDESETARFDMMSDAVDTLTAAGGRVYLDAGDSNWVPAEDMADRLEAAGVHQAAGFALNVSHTEFSLDEVGYAEELRDIVGDDAHYVIDTSRNGVGPTVDNEWCNPLGRAHGRRPTVNTIRRGLDAMLWIKRPGESDGSCNGGPIAGQWWADYALELAEVAGY